MEVSGDGSAEINPGAGFRVQKVGDETDSPELFPLGAWRSRKVMLEVAI